MAYEFPYNPDEPLPSDQQYYVPDRFGHLRRATIPEYLVSHALSKLKVDYYFQYELWSGRNLRGGVVIDWVVFTPRPEPWEYYGRRWHTGTLGADDRMRNARIAKAFGTAEVVIVSEDEVHSGSTFNETLEVVRRKLK